MNGKGLPWGGGEKRAALGGGKKDEDSCHISSVEPGWGEKCGETGASSSLGCLLYAAGWTGKKKLIAGG